MAKIGKYLILGVLALKRAFFRLLPATVIACVIWLLFNEEHIAMSMFLIWATLSSMIVVLFVCMYIVYRVKH